LINGDGSMMEIVGRERTTEACRKPLLTSQERKHLSASDRWNKELGWRLSSRD